MFVEYKMFIRYFCIGLIDFMLKGKSLLEYTNLSFPNEYKKNGKVILKFFQQNLNMLNDENLLQCLQQIQKI